MLINIIRNEDGEVSLRIKFSLRDLVTTECLRIEFEPLPESEGASLGKEIARLGQELQEDNEAKL